MFARMRRTLALVSALLAVSSSNALAAWPHDPDVNVPACTAADNQDFPVTCSDGAGGVFIAWVDHRLGDEDIFAQHITASGTVESGWAANGNSVCIITGNQLSPSIVADGVGGAIIAWEDPRNGNSDIYAQRVTGAGSNLWTSQGVQISTSTKYEFSPRMTSDGAGGAIIVWRLFFSGTDDDVYANHVVSSGAIHSSWPSGGLSIASSGFDETDADIASDGAGGAIIAWAGDNSGNYDVYAQRITYPGAVATGWPGGGAVLTAATLQQVLPRIVADGTGGAIVVWQDFRNGTHFDIYAQRVTSSGAIAPGWLADGAALCTASGSQATPVLVSNGAGGAIAAWDDHRGSSFDIFAQRITGSGTVALGWTTNGVAVCTAAGNQDYETIASDGAGGAIITWRDDRSGAFVDVFAQRITSSGALAPGWTYDGSAISTAPSDQNLPVITSDLTGGAIIVWKDQRTGAFQDIYCQRVELFGQLGNPEPTIESVRDVAADQGGKVRVVWNASYLDANPLYGIGAYWIWRQVPATLAASAVARGATWLNGTRAAAAGGEPDPASLERGLYCTTTSASGVTYSWEYLASQPASGFSTYSYVASTTSDSMASINPYTLFMVQARHTGDGAFWGSPADSGYSVDNLPPLAPSPFTGAYVSGATALHWGRNLEADFAAYRLYRGGAPEFVPSPSNLVVQKADTGYVDPGPGGNYYKLSATDVHGNESTFALLTPASTLDVPSGSTLPRKLSLALVSRNPVRDEARFGLALPRDDVVSLVLYDAGGRLVRTIVKGPLEAGEHTLGWDGRDAAGRRAAAGLYFLHLRATEGRITRRLVVAH